MNPPERRSPIRRVGVRPKDRAGSETRAPIARFMAREQVQKEPGTFHEPRNSDLAVGARFVPNRSADVGTGAEPTQTRGLAERCEPNLGLANGTTRAPAPRRINGVSLKLENRWFLTFF